MQGFIEQVAYRLYKEYGDEISSLYVILPSRRARLFFADALSKITDKPIWQPKYISIDELMSDISGLKQGDSIKLIAKLYKVYSKYHSENFDSFYYWGEMLLSDFDAIDKYIIDAQTIFSNIADIKELESDYSYLTPEQIEIIAQFWKNFGLESKFSKEQQEFLSIWTSLAPIYNDFTQSLLSENIAYTGMMHREATRRIKEGDVDSTITERRYVCAGFNALSECEKRLLSHLQTNSSIDFFWDYDNYYVSDNNLEQEAGLFLRDNIKRFPERLKLPYSYDLFSTEKDITVVGAPSDSLQCKYVHTFLEELQSDSSQLLDKETAIVLTNENLLQPVLYSIPDSIQNINITMGYPFRQTLVYSFVERLIELQNRKRVKGKRVSFYHSDVCGLLSHPFIIEHNQEVADELLKGVIQRQQIHINKSIIAVEGLFSKLFKEVYGWENLADYIIDVCSEVFNPTQSKNDYSKRTEYLVVLNDNIIKLRNSLKDCDLELSDSIFTSLLRRILQTIKIPYEGEPLTGVQIMGILETRNLDFENIIILSVNDDTFPGSMFSSSFIPYNLRVAYNLPTPAHHEGVYAYYFYRLLQRAKRVTVVYCSKSDDKNSGERSRYIHQLIYETSHNIKREEIGVDVNLSSNNDIIIEKEGVVLDSLNEFINSSEKKLSPTSFYNYIECPLKFYFKSIAKIKPEDEVVEDVNSPLFGSILHKAMEILYLPILGKASNKEHIKSLIGSKLVEDAVISAINEVYLKDSTSSSSEYGGNITLTKEILCKYINQCILPYDLRNNDYTITDIEKSVECKFSLSEDRYVTFGGKADRIDLLDSGIIRIVDYKSGAKHIDFKGVESLFSKLSKDRSSAVLQTLLYSLMLIDKGIDVQPALYYIIELNNREYSPLLKDKLSGEYVYRFSDYKSELEEHLRVALTELFDNRIPFYQCEDRSICQWCDYKSICGV